MTRWEYLTVSVAADGGRTSEAITLNQYGSQGWELVSLVKELDLNERRYFIAVFKRPLSSTS
ncbi:MAG: DUF4177 domain-containing protein [Prosthecobacter sp.]|jgi:hypothetical protein|uniref:DUF4177 domain-containing protein n=1 Tax=Prosthecobacter sp. TaxID=1965333 RepID=UPI0019F0577C|nr:DUF4177 domain-containing protein [Prosthecobacter sp.]